MPGGTTDPCGVLRRTDAAGERATALILVAKHGDATMNDPNERMGLGTYLTPEEAKEFHKLFMTSFVIFTLVAAGAHALVWMWRPWL